MIAYDEGMMDEGAASLRDRDMIARRRGGPFVHCVRLFSFCLSDVRLRFLFVLRLLRPAYRIRRVCTSERDRTHPCHRRLSDLVVVNTAAKTTRAQSRMPMSRLLMKKILGANVSRTLCLQRIMQYHVILLLLLKMIQKFNFMWHLLNFIFVF